MSENKKHPNAEFIIAFAEGKQLQYFCVISEKWIDFQGENDPEPDAGPWNSHEGIQWRIKPEQQWVRLAAMKGAGGRVTLTVPAYNESQEKVHETAATFSHWLSDRLYYTPKERP